MILTENGVLKLMQRIKSFITSQLNTKANSVHTHSISEIDDLSTLSIGGGVYSKSEVDTLLTGKADTSHTHTKSQITDFPTIPTKTSDLTNDSGFITSEIDSMGEGWVRFKCGLQICWGVSNVIQCGQRGTVSFAVSFNAFSSDPSLSLTRFGGVTGWAQLQCSIVNLTTTYARINVFNDNTENVSSQSQYSWQAIGYWK